MSTYGLNYNLSIAKGSGLDNLASLIGTERRYDGYLYEADDEFRDRILKRYMRFKNTSGTFYDLVHTAEQAILHECPVGGDMIAIRRQVGLGLIAKNKTGNWLTRLKTACKAFWSCL